MGDKNKLLIILLYLYIICQGIIPSNLKLKGIIFYGDVLLFLLIFVYFISILICRSARERFILGVKELFNDHIMISMQALLIVMLVSIIYSTDKNLALGETIRFLLYIILYFIIKYEIKSKHVIDNILKLYIMLSVVISGLGILQYFTKIGLDKKFIYYGKGYSVNFRISSTMDNPNSLGGFLVLSIFPIIMITLYEKNRKNKIIYGLFSLIIFSNIVLSFSRNAWLGLFVGIVFVTITYNWRAIILLILGGGLGLIIPPIRNRLKDFKYIFNDPRKKMWKIAFDMIKDHPIFGVGNGNYVTLYGDYIKKHPELKYGIYTKFPTHNSYLKVQSELGVLGIAFFAFLIFSTLSKLKRFINVVEDRFYKVFYKGFFISCIAFLIMNISDNLFFVPKISMYFWILVAISQCIIYNNICTRR